VQTAPTIIDDIVVAEYPFLKELCWSYFLPTMTVEEAFLKYEENWKWIDFDSLDEKERNLIEDLTEAFANGCLLC